MEQNGWLENKKGDGSMNTKKYLFIILFVILLQSCSLSNANSNNESDEPITKPDITDDTDNDPVNSTVYDKKLSDFIKLANAFDYESIVGGITANNFFNDIKTRFSDLLIEQQSISDLKSDVERLLDNKTGFYVKMSEPFEKNNTMYRIIVISNEYRENIDGAFDSLFLQIWTEDSVRYEPLVEPITTAGESTTFVDYRFFENELIISIILKKHNFVFNDNESYDLLLFQLDYGQVKNVVPNENERFNNEYWQVIEREYQFYNPDRTWKGLMVYEAGEEPNVGKTSIGISDLELTIYNIEIPESCIKLELNNEAWQLNN